MCECHDNYSGYRYRSAPAMSVPGTQCHDTSECGDPAELILADTVREWVEVVDPGDDDVARVAVDTALYYFEGGASVSEACEEARKLVVSHLRHSSAGACEPHMATAS